jgi:membrane protease YdiL (CAAX protease family)
VHGTSRSVAAACCASLGLALQIGIFLRSSPDRAAAGPAALEIALAGLGSSLALGAFALAGALAQRASLRDNLGLGRSSVKLSPWRVAALIVGFLGCSHLVDLGLSLTPLYDTSALGILERGLRNARGATLALAVVGIAIGPGLCEELLFRGLLLRGLARRWGAGAAILSTSFFFAALHLDPVQGPAAFVLGLYLGAAALASGGTRVPILCHIANNLVALAAAVAGLEALSARGSATLALASGVAALLGMGVLRRAAPEGMPMETRSLQPARQRAEIACCTRSAEEDSNERNSDSTSGRRR